MIITRVGQEPLFDVETLAGAVVSVFPGTWRTFGPNGGPMVWAVDVTPAGQPGFVVSLNSDFTSVHCDGTPEQAAAVAAAVAQVASGTSRLIAFDQSWGWHVDLHPGITPEQVLAGRVVHDEHWSDPGLQGG